MTQNEVKIGWQALKEFLTQVFIRLSVPGEDAEVQADALVWANLRGVDSHGVQRLPWYVEALEIGHINPKPNLEIVKETPAALVIDPDRALGAVSTVFAMNRTIEKAKQAGISWGFIGKTNHQGAMGYYSLMAARKDMAGISWACANTTTAPYGAKVKGIGNNPLAISVPAKRHRPLVLDMAQSIAAGGKITLAREKGIPIPEGWALDSDGNPTTDPSLAEILLPIGGPKGSGLSIMLECLGSLILGFPKIEPVVAGKEKPFEFGGMVGNPDQIRRHFQNSVVVAINISEFIDVEVYKEHVDNLIDGLKQLPKAEGFSEIFVPGEPEWRTLDERSKSGIPVPKKTFESLQKIGERLGIELKVVTA